MAGHDGVGRGVVSLFGVEEGGWRVEVGCGGTGPDWAHTGTVGE